MRWVGVGVAVLAVWCVVAVASGPAPGSWMHNPHKFAQALKRHPVPPKRFVLNLDLPANERWVEIASQFKDKAYLIKAYVESQVPKWVFPIIDRIANDIHPYFKDYGEEMDGIAQGLGVDVGQVVMVNLVYQLESLGVNCSAWNTTGPTPDCPPSQQDGPGLCTSIVAQQEDGTIIHGRNLDWNFEDEFLDLVIDVDYQRANTTVHRSVNLMGMTGVIHGVSPGKFAVSVNARDRGGKVFVNILEALKSYARTPTQHLRYVMEHADDFNGAVEQLASHDLINDMYYTVSGVNSGEGAVMARDRNKCADVWYLNGTSSHDNPNNTQEPWFKLQTNYDHWEPVPDADNRRGPGVAMMVSAGQKGINVTSLATVLHTWPVFNDHTDITALFTPSLGQMSSSVWRD